jgi:hypothetical protein
MLTSESDMGAATLGRVRRSAARTILVFEYPATCQVATQRSAKVSASASESMRPRKPPAGRPIASAGRTM